MIRQACSILEVSRFRLRALFAAAIAVASPQASAQHALETVDEENPNVQLLQAWVAESLAPGDCLGCDAKLAIPADSCRRVPGTGGLGFILDCGKEFQSRTPLFGRVSPLMSSALVYRLSYVTGPSGQRELLAQDLYGNILEIRVVLKQAAYSAPRFQGVGFYSANGAGSGIYFAPKSQLHVVGRVRLKPSREEALVLRFIGWMPFTQGMSSTRWATSRVSFKPYAEFLGSRDGRTLRVRTWESVPHDHVLQRVTDYGGWGGTSSINRERELLAQ